MIDPPPYLIDGESVPSVTTITKRFEDKESLVGWSWSLGRKGQDYREVRDNAGMVGDTAHHLVTKFLTCRMARKPWKQPKESQLAKELRFHPDIVKAGVRRWDAWFRWWTTQDNISEILGTEVRLVSKKEKFGGTIDAIVTRNGKTTILDLKTGSKVHNAHIFQVIAYGILWDENHPLLPIQDYGILHIPSSGIVGYMPIRPESVETIRTTFRKMRALHDYLNLRKKDWCYASKKSSNKGRKFKVLHETD